MEFNIFLIVQVHTPGFTTDPVREMDVYPTN